MTLCGARCELLNITKTELRCVLARWKGRIVYDKCRQNIWKNRSPMLSKCPHVAYVASGFFHVQMVAHGCLMIADFWWFLMISAWPASHLRSHHEDSQLGAWRPSLRGANWNSLGHNMVLSKSGSILINLADFGFNQYPMISELWLTTWCRIWCESVDMIYIYIYDISFYISCYIYKWYFSWCFSQPPRT